MEIARNRIRRDYVPLTHSESLVCDSAYSPVMQVYSAAQNEYLPDRTLSPTVLRPIVNAAASDGSWPTPSANAQLANMKWYVNNVDITTLPAWSGLFTIDTVGSTRGSIAIYKNLTPGSDVTMRFEAELVDNRLGVTIPIRTDEITLSTVDASNDGYNMSVGEDRLLRYNPFLDKLHLYDYKVAHGLISPSSAAEAAARDGNEYQRSFPIEVFKGETKITSGYTVKLYKVNSDTSVTEVSSSDYEVVSISASAIVLDLRLISKADYMVKAFSGSTELARAQFSINRIWADFKASPCNETSILPNQTARFDQAQVDSEGKKVECPENVVKIVWHTATAAINDVEHNEGDTTVFQLDKTGIGKDYTNDWIDVFIEAQQKEEHKVATDGTDVLTDENGNILIFN